MTQLNVTNMTSDQTVTQGKQKKGLTDTQFAILLVLPALALLIVIILYPLLNSMYLGFFDNYRVVVTDYSSTLLHFNKRIRLPENRRRRRS